MHNASELSKIIERERAIGETDSCNSEKEETHVEVCTQSKRRFKINFTTGTTNWPQVKISQG